MWPYGIAGLSLVGCDSPVSLSLEPAHFSPFLTLSPGEAPFYSILVTCFACIFLDFSGCGKSPDDTITSQSITLKTFSEVQPMNV